MEHSAKREKEKGISFEVVELSEEEAAQLEERIKNKQLIDSDYELLEGLLNTFFHLNNLLEEKNLSVKRLLRLFWKKSEKSRNILKDKDKDEDEREREGEGEGESVDSEAPGGAESHGVMDGGVGGDDGDDGDDGDESRGKAKNQKSQRDKKPVSGGHGRNGSDRYPGADQIAVAIDGLKAGDICPSCERGKLYNWKPGKILRLKGSAPVKARIYQIEKLRCSLCQEIFSAQLPKEAGDKKYDEEASSMVALLKYGYGMPFHRLGVLQGNLGIPLPPSTQWDVVKDGSDKVKPVFEELLWEGAQGEVIHNDDTIIEILELMAENESENPERKGIFTTGIVSKSKDHKIALFFSGRNHAGENLTELLEHRNFSLPPPLQMCDALSRNLSSKFKTLLAYCLLHGRRNFVDTLESYPQESQYVIEKLGEIYKNERIAKELKMTPSQRLEFHQQESGPVMDDLKSWFDDQFEEKKVEPNSSLGKAIKYMLKHWKELTLFLRVVGAPLDKNYASHCTS